jgi:EmrB/QacA subfamily drug resistance transporter
MNPGEERMSEVPVPDPRRWIALILLCATQFMLIIDVSIVNVALPTIERDLHFNDSSLQWVASAYALTFGGFLLLGGRCADLLGRRRLFMVGLGVFTLASLACGFANTNNLLIAARAVQGLGAAMIAPAALSILSTTFSEGAERNKALGVWGAISGAGGAVGVLLGGVLTQYVGWEWVFFVNAPIGLAAILLAPRLLHESRVEDAERSFDVIGAITVTASLSLFVYTVVKTDQYHWLSARTLGLFAVSLLLMVAFLVNEQRASHPLLPLSIFRLPTIVGANVVGFMLGAAIFAMFYLLALYTQGVYGLHYTAVRSGIGYLLVACTIIVSAGLSQALVGRFGVRPILVTGLVLLALGLLFFSRVSAHGTYLGDLAPGFVLAGIGLGFAFIPVTIAALMGITDDEAGLASGLINTSQQIGGAVGVALLATVFTSRTTERLQAGVAPATAFTNGLSRAFLVGAVMTVLGLVAALVLIRQGAGELEAAGVEAPVAPSA